MKIKSLINVLNKNQKFEVHLFVTGMHLVEKFGYTVEEVKKEKAKLTTIFSNSSKSEEMDIMLSETIVGLSKQIKKNKPDLIIIHGDRVETLAGAIVGALNNIYVGHIEGGELSGTVDESIRHSVSKLSNFHFVGNADAKRRLIQLGEDKKNIFVIGSPDIDLIKSKLPSLKNVLEYYEINFSHYAIAIFHPVTTEVDKLEMQANAFVDSLVKSQMNYILIYPNNDLGLENLKNLL